MDSSCEILEVLSVDCINVIMEKLRVFVLDFGVTKGLREICKRKWKELCEEEFPKCFEFGGGQVSIYIANCLVVNKILKGNLRCCSLNDANYLIHVLERWFGFRIYIPIIQSQHLYKIGVHTKTNTHILVYPDNLGLPGTKQSYKEMFKPENFFYPQHSLHILITNNKFHIQYGKSKLNLLLNTHLTNIQQAILADVVYSLARKLIGLVSF